MHGDMLTNNLVVLILGMCIKSNSISDLLTVLFSLTDKNCKHRLSYSSGVRSSVSSLSVTYMISYYYFITALSGICTEPKFFPIFSILESDFY